NSFAPRRPARHARTMTFLVAFVAAALAALIVWLALGKKSAGEKSRLETLLAAERDAHTRLANEFKALSAEALKSNNESFLKLAQATLENFQAVATGDLASRQQA